MNNNQTSERALQAGCKGVFMTNSYITLGDAGKPLIYGLKPKDRTCFGGKQMHTTPAKKGQLPEIYLDKKFTWISDGDKFDDTLHYSKQQPEKKKGFNSGDYKRRDEFMKTVRTEQYREQLVSESNHLKAAMASQIERGDVLGMDEATLKAALAGPTQEASAKPFLYDLVYEKDDHSSTGRTARDTKNPTLISKDRRMGTYKTSSQNYGFGVKHMDHEKPMYAKSPVVRSTFYRPRTIPFSNKP